MEFIVNDLDFGIEDYNTTKESIVPNEGKYLGLDISETSTGVCIFRNGVKMTYSFPVSIEDECSVHGEVLLRRKLKSKLKELIGGETFEIILIEDVFQGINPIGTRKLYALNTAIDEMILDNEVGCVKFIRVNNQMWKSWLFTADTKNLTKGMNDKLRIEQCLSMLGIEESGKGYQDRLDATGMVVGYFLCKDKADKIVNMKAKKRVSMEDVVVVYEFEREDVFSRMSNDGIQKYRDISENRWSKTKILDALTEDPSVGYLTEDYVILGRLSDDLGLPLIDGGGILGFWIKPNKLKKYI